MVSDPTLGRIRLEWWREAIADGFAGGPVRRHEVAEALAGAIREYPMTQASFDRLIDARAADLEDQPPATLADLEDYAEGTSSRLVDLALEVSGMRDPAAAEAGHHVGIAYALAGMLRALPLSERTGRRAIPADIAAQTGLDLDDRRSWRGNPALHGAVIELAGAAISHLRAARALRYRVPRGALAALLPAVVAGHSLKRLARAGYDPFEPILARPDPLQSWRLAAAVLRNRF